MKLSVIMPVHNREAFVRESINSILNQTIADFELIIIDDVSSDQTVPIIESIHDDRIRLIKNSFKCTLPILRNEGIDLARGEFVGFMDSDDISMPERFEKEIAFLENHPDHGAVSCHYEIFGDRNAIIKLPLTNEEICGSLLVRCNMNFGGSLFRRSVFEQGHRFRNEYFVCEDYCLWAEIIGDVKLGNLDEVLLRVRFGNHQTTRDSLISQVKNKVRKVLLEEIHRELFMQLQINFPEEWINQYNYYLLNFRTDYDKEEQEILKTLYDDVAEQLNLVHSSYLSGFRKAYQSRYPFLNLT